jgi:hypothetical protein
MSKPPPRPILSDDYEIVQGGVTYHPHEGECIHLVGRPSIRDLETIWAFEQLSENEEEGKPEPPEALAEDANDEAKAAYGEALRAYLKAHAAWRKARNEQLDAELRRVCQVLAQHIVGWTWTNERGVPIDYPADPAAAVETRESAAERKNGSSASESGPTEPDPSPMKPISEASAPSSTVSHPRRSTKTPA